MKMKGCVMFDLDGTLFDSSEGIKMCYRKGLEHFGIHVEDDGELDKVIGPSLYDSYHRFFGLNGDHDKGRGPVATVLVQNGTLHTGDIIVAGTSVGRVRAMLNDKGEKVESAGPSIPVEITGLDEAPTGGDTFDAVSDERLARELVEQRKQKQKDEIFKQRTQVTLDNLFSQMQEGEMKELKIIIKADVQGSVEAVRQSLVKLSH